MKTEEEINQEELVNRLLATHFAGVEDIPNDIVPFQPKEVTFHKEDRNEDVTSDYEVVRKAFHAQLEMLDTASRTALMNALGSGSARHTEVFAKLMDTMSNTAEKLLKVQKQMNELQGKAQGEVPKIGTQNVYFGTTNDLLSRKGGSQDTKEMKIIEHEPTNPKT